MKIPHEVKRHLKAFGFSVGVLLAGAGLTSIIGFVIASLGIWSLLLLPAILIFAALYQFALEELF